MFYFENLPHFNYFMSGSTHRRRFISSTFSSPSGVSCHVTEIKNHDDMYLLIYLYVMLIFMCLPKHVGETEKPRVRRDCSGNENDSRGRQTLHVTDVR